MESKTCVMCSASIPTLFQYFLYDHIPTFFYIFIKNVYFYYSCIMQVGSIGNVICIQAIGADLYLNNTHTAINADVTFTMIEEI